MWQGAPAVLARNIDLPVVQAKDEKPFVFAARFPNGAVAIGAQERTSPGRAWYLPPCDVTLHVKDAPGPFGIFGEYQQLTLIFSRSLKGKRILAQDLAGDEAVDITDLAEIDGTILRIAGGVLRHVGLSSRTRGDLSSPAVVLALV